MGLGPADTSAFHFLVILINSISCSFSRFSGFPGRYKFEGKKGLFIYLSIRIDSYVLHTQALAFKLVEYTAYTFEPLQVPERL